MKFSFFRAKKAEIELLVLQGSLNAKEIIYHLAREETFITLLE